MSIGSTRVVGRCAFLVLLACTFDGIESKGLLVREPVKDRTVVEPLNATFKVVNVYSGSTLDMIRVSSRNVTENAIKTVLKDNDESKEDPAIAEAKKYVESKSIQYPRCLSKSEGLAISAYTAPLPNCQERFNAATRERIFDLERNSANDNPMVGWKRFFHQIKSGVDKLKIKECLNVYRGVRGSHSQLTVGDLINFRQFTSTSKDKYKAFDFAKPTLYEINTCEGADIEKISVVPAEKEVLIPPTEFFEISSVKEKTISPISGPDRRITVFEMRSKGSTLFGETRRSIDVLCNGAQSGVAHGVNNIVISAAMTVISLYSLLNMIL